MLIAGHSQLTDQMAKVPPGKRVVFLTPAGQLAYAKTGLKHHLPIPYKLAGTDKVYRHALDVSQLLRNKKESNDYIKNLRQLGYNLVAYNSNNEYPNHFLRPNTNDSGVIKHVTPLPLQNNRPGIKYEPRTISELLKTLPEHTTYLVNCCRALSSTHLGPGLLKQLDVMHKEQSLCPTKPCARLKVDLTHLDELYGTTLSKTLGKKEPHVLSQKADELDVVQQKLRQNLLKRTRENVHRVKLAQRSWSNNDTNNPYVKHLRRHGTQSKPILLS